MNQHPEIQVDLSLIGRYLAGEASPEEAFAVDAWRELSAESNVTFETAARLWDEAHPVTAWRPPDSAAEWQQLQGHLEITPLPIRRTLFTPMRIAATVLVLLGAALLAWLLVPHKTATTPAYSKVISSGKAVLNDTLPDASVVTLAKNSRLSVSHSFAASSREVLLQGEGYFSVKTQTGQPFTVLAGGVRIVVLGTAFNVKEDSASVTVAVSSGAVKMYKDTASIIVNAGKTGIYTIADQKLRLLDTVNRNSYSYATRSLYFYNMSLGEVKQELEKAYNVHVVLENPLLAQCRLNTQFEEQPLQYVLEVIAASLGIQYRIEQNTVYFFGNECS
ncbi:MAG TPA: FecR domain-containing protein [Chitinophaga sp.]|uniref:FecR family protein n=1 Tax=Chitinophaga sp. TaxID=1869181 RepID=UPI002C1B6FDF|nr:FecR domain-containing protein [Chitinophaga sp.]HVI47151.1 FecR domain-containing protein [Chitinophaga sp.]